MVERHDLASESVVTLSGFPRAPEDPDAADRAVAADPLSDVLRTVKLTGALFFVVDASSPWGVNVPRAERFAPIILPHARHVVSYHVVTRGSGFASIDGGHAVPFNPGDVLVVPHGDPYAMTSGRDVRTESDIDSALAFFRAMASGELPFVVTEGGGGPEHAQFVCGFLGCDARPFNPLLAALPPLMRVERRADAPDLLDRLIELTLIEAQGRRVGGECIRLRLSELMFVEVIRRHLESIPPERTGWLAGLRDQRIGRALALLHARPAHAWTLDALAKEACMSRSVLADRFAQLVGHPPMQYLAQWRVQLAARQLADGGTKVSAIALAVGYASEAAFSRSFKKISGLSPAQWRARCAASDA
jgi:AraC-like DNA-binding protein